MEGKIAFIMEEYIELFIDEMREHLEKLNDRLLELEGNQSNVDIVNELFRLAHTMKGMASCMNFEKMAELTHKMEDVLGTIRNCKANVDTSLVNLLFKCNDFLEKSLEALKEKGEEKKDGIEQIIKELKSVVEGKGRVNSKSNLTINEKQAEKKENFSGGQPSGGIIRVPGYKMESLANMVGELHILQSQIQLELSKYIAFNDPISNKINRMSKIINQVQNLCTSMQMVTLHATFNKLSRIARNTILELNKNVKFEIAGEDTEIDRAAVENLADLLMHLVKNAIAHGIEQENERIKKGKPPEGLVKIVAYSKRESVYIEVHDDGCGIDTEKVFKKALDKGFIDPSKQYTDEEINNFIFLPGFSTADTVDSISGRGVGTDVVKTELKKIGGDVSVTSEKDKGCIFTLKIPINMFAIKGTIISIAGEEYILPTSYIKEIKKFNDSYWVRMKGKQSMIEYRNQVISVIPIYSLLDINDNSSATNDLFIVIEYEQEYKALFIDKVIGNYEVIIKPLEKAFRHLKLFSGITILNDGSASLILDVEGLFKYEHGGETNKCKKISI